MPPGPDSVVEGDERRTPRICRWATPDVCRRNHQHSKFSVGVVSVAVRVMRVHAGAYPRDAKRLARLSRGGERGGERFPFLVDAGGDLMGRMEAGAADPCILVKAAIADPDRSSWLIGGRNTARPRCAHHDAAASWHATRGEWSGHHFASRTGDPP
jgi:hypothetical protein